MRRQLFWLAILWAVAPAPAWATPFELLIPKTIEINTAWWGAGLPIHQAGVLIAGDEPIDFPRLPGASLAKTKHRIVWDTDEYGFWFFLDILVLPAWRGGRALAPNEVAPMGEAEWSLYGHLLRPGETHIPYNPGDVGIGMGLYSSVYWPRQGYTGTVTVNGRWKLDDEDDALFYTMQFIFAPREDMGVGLDGLRITEVQRVSSVPVPEPTRLGFGVVAGLAWLRRTRRLLWRRVNLVPDESQSCRPRADSSMA
jgi:hypothetical protein